MGTNPAIAKRLPLEELEALVEVVFLGASSDGELSAEEEELAHRLERECYADGGWTLAPRSAGATIETR